MLNVQVLKKIYFSRGDVKLMNYLIQNGGYVRNIMDTELEKVLDITGIAVRIKHLVDVGAVISKSVINPNDKRGRYRTITYRPDVPEEIKKILGIDDLSIVRFGNIDLSLISFLYNNRNYIVKPRDFQYTNTGKNYDSLRKSYLKLSKLNLIDKTNGYINIYNNKIDSLIDLMSDGGEEYDRR